MNANTTTEAERQAAIADRARMDAALAFEDELLAAEQRGREFLKTLEGQRNPLLGARIPIARTREHA